MTSVKLTFPKSINVYQDVELHGEEPILVSDYTLEGFCNIDVFDSWTYKNHINDLQSEGTIKFDVLKTSMKHLTFGNDGTNDIAIKTAGSDISNISLGERFLEIIAYTLFTHPLAKAPISNATDIVSKESDVCTSVEDQFNNDAFIRKSLIEQLMKHASSRFNVEDANFVAVPIQKDDVIQFMIHYNGDTKQSANIPTNTDLQFKSPDILNKTLNYSILVKISLV